jgi:CDP-paratose 2-epimerase
VKVIITGGAGFIGCNAASRYLREGNEVVVVDNLSRRGAEKNLSWLKEHGDLTFIHADIRSAQETASLFRRHRDADRILHLAAQVAVTTSVIDPALDFEINALGTFNVLEAMRANDIEAPLIYSSTNKVYGEMTEVGIVKVNGHYGYEALPYGVPEERALDFHSPYGCSKGAADQYVIDYHRIYGLRTIALRQSCIYGWRQFGMEDQGWLAWFMIAMQLGRRVTVYGDGCQVRDVLFVDDLLDAYECAFEAGPKAYGRAYNIGGGPKNTLSLLDLMAYITERTGTVIPHSFDGWRPGDQKVFISDIRRAQSELGWSPKTNVRSGLRLLFDWVAENRSLFEEAVAAVA